MMMMLMIMIRITTLIICIIIIDVVVFVVVFDVVSITDPDPVTYQQALPFHWLRILPPLQASSNAIQIELRLSADRQIQKSVSRPDPDRLTHSSFS